MQFSTNALRFHEICIKKKLRNVRKQGILLDFEFGAVQRNVNLVDLEKCFKNAYLDAKIGVDTAENEPEKSLQLTFFCKAESSQPLACVQPW